MRLQLQDISDQECRATLRVAVDNYAIHYSLSTTNCSAARCCSRSKYSRPCRMQI